MSVEQMSLEQMSLEQMYEEQLSLVQTMWTKVFRTNGRRPNALSTCVCNKNKYISKKCL